MSLTARSTSALTPRTRITSSVDGSFASAPTLTHSAFSSPIILSRSSRPTTWATGESTHALRVVPLLPMTAPCHFFSTAMTWLLTSAASLAHLSSSLSTSSTFLPLSTGDGDADGEVGSYTSKTEDCSSDSGGKKSNTLCDSWNCLILYARNGLVRDDVEKTQ